MSKHTPGPWFVWKERAMQEEGLDASEINEELLEFDYFEVMSGKPTGEVSRGRIKGCNTVVEIDADDFANDPDEGRAIALANARLIAAAPDLLNQLVIARDRIIDLIMQDDPQAYKEAKKAIPAIEAAILKAKGE